MERHLAIIKLGTAESIIVVDPDDALTIEHFGGHLLPENHGVNVGDIFDGDIFLAPPKIKTDQEINTEITKQLLENDLKIIRALVDNDIPRINAHKATQAALRLQLK